MAPGGEFTLTSSPTYVNVGEHTVYYQVSGKSNGRVLQGKETVKITGLPGSLTLSKTSAEVLKGGSTIVTATNKSGGNVTASSSNASVATVSKSGNTFTIRGVGAGSCTISFTGAAAGAYSGASKRLSVTVIDCPTGNFSTASSWSDVQTIVRMDRANTQFSVGQTRTVNLSSIGAGTATITLVDIASDGKSITCMFTKYSGTTPQHYMNSTATNDGSWKSSSMRYWVNNYGFYNGLPDDLKSVISETTVITGTYHSGPNDAAFVESVDKLWLPAEKEIFEVTEYAWGERSLVKQFEYFKSHKIGTISTRAWLRSPCTEDSRKFCFSRYYESGEHEANIIYYVYPCFTIK